MSETVIWRQWFNCEAIEALTAMGTLPSNEFEVEDEASFYDGSDVAQAIAEEQHNFDSTEFAEGGRIVIVKPEKWAGVYDIGVDWSPTFYANPTEA